MYINRIFYVTTQQNRTEHDGRISSYVNLYSTILGYTTGIRYYHWYI